mmetsp:Transcript_1184/g.1958  ORF Transcript_1184/g.1958 Transcript_1184/m.1958 type:complete len:458 (-) Transcript_1184:38-1411(-)
MLSKCMLSPIKLARAVQWKGRLGKSSALLCIDITNQQIGLSLAYYRQQIPAHDDTDSNAENNNNSESVSNNATTLITPLPPIPYMSNKPYHPSYAFLHRPELDKQQATTSLRRKERTLEIANQLAHLAKQREVNDILIRWPGDLGGFVCGSSTSKEELSKTREEDQLLLSLEDDGRRSSSSNIGQTGTVHEHGDGSMGYLRGRILFVLDSCCNSHGHNETKVSSEPLLMEGARPFALWDTSNSEQDWVLDPQHKSTPSSTNRVDKYGNSFTETDSWGRSAIFGNNPPKPTQGQFRYSSKQLHYGYRVSCEFGSSKAASEKPPSRAPHRDNFDSFQDSESYLKQFEGSLAAMHALYEFAGVHLKGKITLPSWVSTSPETNNRDKQPGAMGENELLSEDPSTVHRGYHRSTNTAGSSTNNSKQAGISKTDSSAPPRKVPLVALAKMPVRRRRREADRRS